MFRKLMRTPDPEGVPKFWDGVMMLAMTGAMIAVVLLSVRTCAPPEVKDENTTTLDEPIEQIEADQHKKHHPEAYERPKY